MLIHVNRKVKKALILSLSLAAVIPSIHALSVNPDAMSNGFGNLSSQQCISQQNGEWKEHPDNDGSICYLCNGEMMKNYWYQNPNNGHVRYLDKNGKMVTNSWEKHPYNNDSLCYINYDGLMEKKAWIPSLSGGMRYVDENGKMVKNDWAYNAEKNQYYYLGDNGKRVTNAIVAHRDNDDSQCFVNEIGVIARNYWYYDKIEHYYFDINGKMVKNKWVYSDRLNSKCYFGSDGKRVTNSIISHPDNDDSQCFVGDTGVIYKNYWYYDKRDHYYFDINGKMVKNDWVYSDILNSKCYFGSDGKRVTNSIISHPDNDGSLCRVDRNGIMYRNYWYSDGINKYYFDNEGKMAKNQWIITDRENRRFLNGDGVLIKNQWLKHPDYENSLCYVNNYGNMAKNYWISHPFYDSVICFMNDNGVVSNYLSCTLGENGQIIEDQINNPSLYQNMDLNNIQPNQEQDVNTMEEDELY